MKLLLFCPKAFETMEFSVFIDVMGWARDDYGCDITVETCGFQKIVTSTFGVPVVMDTTVDTVRTEDYAAMAIPGGFREYGFDEEAYSEKALQLIRAFDTQGKPIATVCVAALALARSGILEGRRATTYHLRGGSRQQELASFGVDVVNEPVVVDKNVITSYCPQTAPEVAFRLLELLGFTQEAALVREAMGYAQSN